MQRFSVPPVDGGLVYLSIYCLEISNKNWQHIFDTSVANFVKINLVDHEIMGSRNNEECVATKIDIRQKRKHRATAKKDGLSGSRVVQSGVN